MARVWLATSRFADTAALASATLILGPDADAFYDRGRARTATGQPRLALDDYEQALALYREAGNRGNEAATLTSIGRVYEGLGSKSATRTPHSSLNCAMNELPATNRPDRSSRHR